MKNRRGNPGPRNIGQKLCARNVAKIKREIKAATHGDLKLIAIKYRVSQSNISKIKHGVHWKYVK